MNLAKYIEDKSKESELAKKLIDELKKISEDEEFIVGVFANVYNDEDKKTLLEYIEKGEDVNYEQVILNSLWLGEQRDKIENNITDNDYKEGYVLAEM